MPIINRGFSVIELLVVVAIIAVLSALILGGIPTMREQARSTKCLNNLRQLGMSILAYPSEQRGHLPPAMKDWSKQWGPPWNADKGIIWQVLRDAGHIDEYAGGGAEYQLHLHPHLRCPSGRRQSPGGATVHYSATSELLGQLVDGTTLPYGAVRAAGRVVVVADVATATFSWWPVWFNPAGWWPASSGTYTGWSAPHRMSTNWLMLDGHVENVRYRGTFHAGGAAFCAINQPWRYDRRVNQDGGANPVVAPDEYLWSRNQMRVAP